MSLLERDEVPEPKSPASTRPTVRPRETASRATPAPTTPPPTTRTWCSVAASAVSAAARSAGPSLVVEVAGLPFPCWPFPGTADRPPGQTRISARRGTLRHHDLHALELLQVGVAGGSHGPAQCAHQVHRAVGDRRRAMQDLLNRADRADLEPGAPRQVRVM